MEIELKPADNEALIEVLENRADNLAEGSSQEFFQNLVASAYLPREWTRAIQNRFTGNIPIDARRLIDWAVNKKVNPDDPRFTALGALLQALLKQKPPPDESRTIVAVLLGYRLILDQALVQDIGKRYMVPVPSPKAAGEGANEGPDFDWLGPASDVQLQSYFKPEPAWLDVGFLRSAMKCSASVCRVELGPRSGTGFLVTDTLMLTNFHVLVDKPGEDLNASAKLTKVRFGAFTLSGGDPDAGKTFNLADDPIVAQSPVGELDFVLLRADDKIRAVEAIQRAEMAKDLPAANSALNMLHHPAGDTMKLSLSGNGVSGVYADRGIIQYVTAAASGSSGSPCFSDDWKVVGLHHAQRARAFGSIREGILIRSILERIQQYL